MSLRVRLTLGIYSAASAPTGARPSSCRDVLHSRTSRLGRPPRPHRTFLQPEGCAPVALRWRRKQLRQERHGKNYLENLPLRKQPADFPCLIHAVDPEAQSSQSHGDFALPALSQRLSKGSLQNAKQFVHHFSLRPKKALQVLHPFKI